MTLSAVAQAVADIIAGVDDVGRVWPHEPYHRDDLLPLLTAEIMGRPVLRAWWLLGPRLDSTRVCPIDVTRDWTFTIAGVVGITGNGDSLVTLRDLAEQVTDALDADDTLGGSVHRSQPCRWADEPDHRVLWGGVACSYIEIDKTVTTVTETA